MNKPSVRLFPSIRADLWPITLMASLMLASSLSGCGTSPKGHTPSAARGDGPSVLLAAQTEDVSRSMRSQRVPMQVTKGAECGASGAAQREMLMREINRIRHSGARCGSKGSFSPAGDLTWNTKLESASAVHARSMASYDYFSHTGVDGTSGGIRARNSGYEWSKWAENIAGGQESIRDVVSDWVRSDGHCANLMNPNMREMGLACVKSKQAHYGTYWVLVMGMPR